MSKWFTHCAPVSTLHTQGFAWTFLTALRHSTHIFDQSNAEQTPLSMCSLRASALSLSRVLSSLAISSQLPFSDGG